MQHRLSNKDKENLTATCAVCGPNTPMKINYRGYVMCRVKYREDQRKISKNKSYYLNKKWGNEGLQYHVLVSAFLESQHGKCAICKEFMTNPQLDHCHETNEIRGLLCRSCNIGLGHFKDDKIRLESAIKYLTYE